MATPRATAWAAWAVWAAWACNALAAAEASLLVPRSHRQKCCGSELARETAARCWWERACSRLRKQLEKGSAQAGPFLCLKIFTPRRCLVAGFSPPTLARGGDGFPGRSLRGVRRPRVQGAVAAGSPVAGPAKPPSLVPRRYCGPDDWRERYWRGSVGPRLRRRGDHWSLLPAGQWPALEPRWRALPLLWHRQAKARRQRRRWPLLPGEWSNCRQMLWSWCARNAPCYNRARMLAAMRCRAMTGE